VKFREKILENGLQLIGEVNEHAKTAAVGFFVNTGSRDETPEVSGVSHFLEHMMFKGTNQMDALQVNAAFDATGAQFNAFTSEECTVYYAAVLPEYLAEVTRLWIELMRPSLRDEDFDLEKNVIKEEIAMYQDMPNFEVLDRCRTLHFDSHPCGNSVLGTLDSIDALTSQQMRSYFGLRYAPNNMTLVWAGNFDWDAMVHLTERQCSVWQARAVSRDLSHCPGSFKTDRLVQPKLVREHISLMSHGVSFQDERRHAAKLLTVILGDDTCSRYYWALVDKALAESASMSIDIMDGTGILYSYLKCSPDRSAQVLEVVRSLLTEAREKGVTEDELRIAKNKKLSALVIRNELPMGRLIDLGVNWTYLHQYRLVQEEIEAIKAVTVQDIKDLMDQIDPSRFTLYSIGP
jgi:predicted Zn-dependent peptidase